MVEIVGYDERKFRETTCNRCAAKLRYTPNETHIVKYTCCGSPESDECVTCPNCGNEVTV